MGLVRMNSYVEVLTPVPQSRVFKKVIKLK
jgi:hypothetical protein